MTPLAFSAQYQQRPIPLEGNIIKREWLRFFKGSLPRQDGDYFVISWDTAMKSSELADYSVGTVWQVQERRRTDCRAHRRSGRARAPCDDFGRSDQLTSSAGIYFRPAPGGARNPGGFSGMKSVAWKFWSTKCRIFQGPLHS
jgi:hypothetical protein